MVPPLTRYPSGHLAACHHPLNVTRAEIEHAERDPSSPLSAGDELPDVRGRGAAGAGLLGPERRPGPDGGGRVWADFTTVYVDKSAHTQGAADWARTALQSGCGASGVAYSEPRGQKGAFNTPSRAQVLARKLAKTS